MSDDRRRSRRTKGEGPEFEVDFSKRVTPPRTSKQADSARAEGGFDPTVVHGYDPLLGWRPVGALAHGGSGGGTASPSAVTSTPVSKTAPSRSTGQREETSSRESTFEEAEEDPSGADLTSSGEFWSPDSTRVPAADDSVFKAPTPVKKTATGRGKSSERPQPTPTSSAAARREAQEAAARKAAPPGASATKKAAPKVAPTTTAQSATSSTTTGTTARTASPVVQGSPTEVSTGWRIQYSPGHPTQIVISKDKSPEGSQRAPTRSPQHSGGRKGGSDPNRGGGGATGMSVSHTPPSQRGGTGGGGAQHNPPTGAQAQGGGGVGGGAPAVGGGAGGGAAGPAGGGGGPVPPPASPPPGGGPPPALPPNNPPPPGGGGGPGGAGGAPAGAGQSDEERAQARALRVMASSRRKIQQRAQELDRIWARARKAMMLFTENPTGPRASENVRTTRNLEIQAKERRQEILTDYRMWMDAVYEAGLSPDDEDTQIAWMEGRYQDIVHDHEHNAANAAIFLKKRDEEDKVRLEPVDPRLFKLPALSMQEFHGDKEKFMSFKQNFEVCVGQQKLKDHQKLAHLRGCLRGKALDSIVSLGTEDHDYRRAWDILTARYGDKTELTSSLLKAMQRITLPVGANAGTQRKYCDDVMARYHRLVEIDPEIRNHHSTLMPIIQNYFSHEVKRELVKALGKTPRVEDYLAKAQELINIEVHVRGQNENSSNARVDRRLQSPRRDRRGQSGKSDGGSAGTTAGLAATNPTRGQLKRGGPPAGAGGSRGGGSFRGASRGRSDGAGKRGDSTRANTSGFKCPLCHQPGHGLPSCLDFKKLSVRDRLDKAREFKACYKCLKVGHMSTECPGSRKCGATVDGKECGRTSHHQMLHRGGNKSTPARG
jgi:hypothetical protein